MANDLRFPQRENASPKNGIRLPGTKTGTREDARVLNSYLDAMQLKVYDIQKQMLEANIDLSAETSEQN